MAIGELLPGAPIFLEAPTKNDELLTERLQDLITVLERRLYTIEQQLADAIARIEALEAGP